MSLDDNFKAAVDRMNRISKDVHDQDLYKKYGESLVQLYGYYKMATIGPNINKKPGVLDLKGRKKWNVWTKVTEMKITPDQAKGYYIKIILDIIQKTLQ
jgi:diazepam-binding inhibitor (GABA receptor modulating acyl-CoA-binding protein)